MAWRPERLVKAGEIDNTQLGWTVGWLELEGVEGWLATATPISRVGNLVFVASSRSYHWLRTTKIDSAIHKQSVTIVTRRTTLLRWHRLQAALS